MSEETKSSAPRSDLPEGTVTFIFTDIEDSTELLKTLGDSYAALLSKQRDILRNCFVKWNGKEVDTQGDAFFYSFPRATEAVSAAVEAQRAMAAYAWPEGAEACIRMGLHTGEPSTWEEGYVGMDVHRAARIAHVGHGGQVLLSDTTASLVRNDRMEGVGLLELGKYRLKGLRRPKRIYQLEIDGLPSEFPPLKSPDAGLPPHNLPPQPTPFVGRGPELEALDAMIADPDVRLISIVAAGGMGKTRIALASSEHQLSINERTNGKLEARFPQGVYFVPLAPLDSPRSIVPTIAEALNFQIESNEAKKIGSGGETRSPKQQLLDYVRSKRLLLLMDNFEHLLEGASLLSEIIGLAPEVKILVTSRERLHLKGEQLFPLLGMKFPDLDKNEASPEIDPEAYSALALFQQSAQRIQPDFTIAENDIEDVTSICRLVGGMPLGIELSASWVNVLTVNEIAKEIQRSLDFLETTLRDIDVRHRSMRVVFDSTLERLNNTERDLFIRLTVFHGDFTREAAHEIAGASLNLLGVLTSRSLLQFDRAQGTCEMHELLRQFGAERLAQDSEKEKTVRDKHSTYYCHLLSQLETSLKGSRHMEAMEEVEADFENFTAAWEWAVEQNYINLVTSVLEAMDVYYEYSGRWEEGERLFRGAAERVPSSQSVDTLLLCMRLNNILASYIPDKRMDEGKVLTETNLELLETPALAQEDTRFEEAYLMTIIGGMKNDPKEAQHHFQHAYDLFKSLNDRWWTAILLRYLGAACQTVGNIDGGIDKAEKSLAIYRDLGFEKGITRALNTLSALLVHHMDWDNADRYLQESLKISEAMDDRRDLGWTLLFVGFLKMSQGLFTDACRIFNESLDINKELGNTYSVVYANLELARIHNHFGKYQEAMLFAQKTQTDAEKEKYELWRAASLLVQGDSLLGQGEFRKARALFEEGISFYREFNISYITSALPNLCNCMYAQRDFSAMQGTMQETLQNNERIDRPHGYLGIFPALSLLKLIKGELVQAVELYAYASSYRYVAESKWFYDVVGRHIELAAESLSPEVVAAAQERGRNLDPNEVTKEVLIELEARDESVNNG